MENLNNLRAKEKIYAVCGIMIGIICMSTLLFGLYIPFFKRNETIWLVLLFILLIIFYVLLNKSNMQGEKIRIIKQKEKAKDILKNQNLIKLKNKNITRVYKIKNDKVIIISKLKNNKEVFKNKKKTKYNDDFFEKIISNEIEHGFNVFE